MEKIKNTLAQELSETLHYYGFTINDFINLEYTNKSGETFTLIEILLKWSKSRDTFVDIQHNRLIIQICINNEFFTYYSEKIN